jgi:hypothetical protein
MVTLIVGIMLVALFLLAFISGRRFGLLGLGLAAGVLLAGQTFVFVEEVFMVFKQYLGGISPAQATAILLVLAPSLILMLSGPKYHSGKMRLIGALLYTVMAGFAILPFVMSSVDIPNEVKNVITASHVSAIAIGIIVAVVDNFLTRHHKQ